MQVPPSWSAAAYPSNKPLASWLVDLVKRVAFMRQWLTTGLPAAFWLPGMALCQCHWCKASYDLQLTVAVLAGLSECLLVDKTAVITWAP